MTVRILTDSTADFTVEEAEALGITVVPLTVFFGEEAYLDNGELDNATFYKKLQASKELPRTSQPSPIAFQAAYTRLIEEGATGIISTHLSSKLSGTYQSACAARDTLSEDQRRIPIEVIDSQTVTSGIGLSLRKAVEMARENRTLEEIQRMLVERFARTRIFAALDTLEFVKRGGRIGAARAFLGNMLSVKPIIAIKDGEVVPVEQPRTRSKAYARIAQITNELQPLEEIAVVASNDEVGQQLAEVLKTLYAGEIPQYKLGAVIGTHAGPGAAGVVAVSSLQE